MGWTVYLKKDVVKEINKLPQNVQFQLEALVNDLHCNGPIRGNWRNYSKLNQTQHHCHIKSGKPTYVVCWQVIDKVGKIIGVYYVGTHEKAPY